MSDFDWMTSQISVQKVFKGPDGTRQVQSLGTMTGMPEPGELLTEMLDAFLIEAFSKKPSTGETASCKLYSLSDNPMGREDRELLDEGLQAIQSAQFEEVARKLASRYARQEHSREGILVFLQSLVTAGKGNTKLPFFVLFKCDFEDARRFEAPAPAMELAEEVVLNSLKKFVIYPYFNGYEQSPDHLLVYQKTPSDYFETLLSVDVPLSTGQLMEAEIHKALRDRFETRFDGYFKEPPPSKREMFSEQAYVDLNDLLGEEEVTVVSHQAARNAKDLHDKDLKVRVKIDDVCRFEAHADQFNRSYFFAQRGEEKFLIIKGTHFEASNHLSTAEFLRLEDLDVVLSRVAS